MNNYSGPRGLFQLPTIVKNLLIINLLAYLISFTLERTQGIQLNDILGLHYYKSADFRWYQIITHMFMHGSWMHVFSNMFSLWMFGSLIEQYWGPKKFLFYYLATGLGAATLHSLVQAYEIYQVQAAADVFLQDPSRANFSEFITKHVSGGYQMQFTQVLENWQMGTSSAATVARDYTNDYLNIITQGVTVGASGAVFGVLLAFGVMFAETHIYIYFAIPIKAKYFVALYALWEFFAGVQNSAGDNVAHFAHIGGMVFGAIIMLYWRKFKSIY